MQVFLGDILGHDREIGALRRAHAAGRLHHAYLFSGPEGVGKRSTAAALAGLVNCEQPQGDLNTLDACGRCSACLKLAAGQHPDLLVIEPEGRFIKIDQVRAVSAATRFRPYEGARRFVLVDKADALHEAAANALLKTLEEPRGDTMFALVTTSPHLLLETIRSRCQPLRFGHLTGDHVTRILTAQGVDETPARRASGLCGGSVTAALQVLDSPVYAAREDLIERLVSIGGAPPAAAVVWGEELAKSGDLSDLFDVFRGFYRDVALAKTGVSTERLWNRDLEDRVCEVAAAHSLPQILAASDAIDDAARLLTGNVNPRMVVESLLIELSRPDPRRTPMRRP